MIQVQRFNKALKLAVILGDLVILNVLFISSSNPQLSSSASFLRLNVLSSLN